MLEDIDSVLVRDLILTDEANRCALSYSGVLCALLWARLLRLPRSNPGLPLCSETNARSGPKQKTVIYDLCFCVGYLSAGE